MHAAPHIMPDVERFSSIENLLYQVELLPTTPLEQDAGVSTNTEVEASRVGYFFLTQHRTLHPPRHFSFRQFECEWFTSPPLLID